MMFRRVSRCLAIVVILALLLAHSPLPHSTAQDGLPADQQQLLDRVLAGITALNTYTSYRVATEFNVIQDFNVSQGGQVFDSQRVEFIRQENGTYVAGEPSPNVAQHMLVSEIFTPATGIPDGYILEGDVRVVDGASYVQAAYSQDEPDLPAVPPGWFELTDPADLQVWPGLNTLISPTLYVTDLNAAPVARILDISAEEAQEFARVNALAVTSDTVTLDDGRTGEAISVVLDNAALDMVGIGTSGADAVDQLILDAITGNPLGITFIFANDQVIGYSFAVQISINDLDISSAPDVPAGFTISLNLTQTFTATLSDINTDLPLVAAPDVQGTALSIFGAPEVTTSDYPWWNDRVFYEVFVRSFYDSDGDGIGDLQGVIEKLDYLNDGDPATTDDLGVTGIWLMPIAQSPSYHGYDVTDYTTIEQDYGTNEDFRALLDAAHARGIVVIVDLVLNHTSSEHPWFIAAESGDPAYEDYYIWSDDPPADLSPWGSQVWHPAGDRYYFGLFWSGMPDLNYDNPAVTDEMYAVIDFWLTDMGVDGFRLDAIRHLDEDGPIMENTPETLAWLEDFHVYVHDLSPDALTVGEVWDSTANVAPYVGDKVNIAFEFDLASAILTAARLQSASPVVYTLDTITATYPAGQYATFITNHDQNRVFDQLGQDMDAAKVAATLLLTSPGVPFIYYGEEVGMSGEKPDERIRTPMQWTAARINGGFTDASQPWEAMASGYRLRNVATMSDDPDSLLNHYRALIHLRNAHPALRTGSTQLVATDNPHVFAMLRFDADETLLVLINLDDAPVTDYALSAPATPLNGDLTAAMLLGTGTAAIPALDDAGGFTDYVPFDELAPRSSTVILLQ